VWFGVGAGCGCLSLVAAIAVVLVVLYAVGSSSGPGPGPGQREVGPGPGPGGPGPGPPPGPGPQNPLDRPPTPPPGPPSRAQGGGVQGIDVELKIFKTENRQPVRETSGFRAGEQVGAGVRWLRVERNFQMSYVWFRLEGDQFRPIGQPKPVDNVGPALEGRGTMFTLETQGAPPGTYGFLLATPTGPGQFQAVKIGQFTIQ
jgi:hypothetical protein